MQHAVVATVLLLATGQPIGPGALADARERFAECSGTATVSVVECVDPLKAIAEDPEGSQQSREFALEALAWLDVEADALDLRAYFERIRDDERTRSPIRVAAAVYRWIPEVFGSDLGVDDQRTLLLALARGTVEGKEVGLFVRRWAATELCAQGVMGEPVRSALVDGFGSVARGTVRSCEQQAEFLRGAKTAPEIDTALEIRDWSNSQTFRRYVIKVAMARKMRASDEQVIASVRGGWRRPKELLVAREALTLLRSRGWSASELAAKGIDSRLFAEPRGGGKGAQPNEDQ